MRKKQLDRIMDHVNVSAIIDLAFVILSVFLLLVALYFIRICLVYQKLHYFIH